MTLLDELTARTEEMARATLDLCLVESPSEDFGRLAQVAEHTAELGTRLLGRAPEWITERDRPALYWEPAPGGVLLLGHLDTVWPVGTLARWPKPLCTPTTLSCPGVFDMKAGVVQGLYAMAALGSPAGCGMLLTTDEEIGSPVSRPLIEKVAARAGAVLVLEASADGALKTGRKGVSQYVVRVLGRAAHAGLEPEKGVNALLELAEQARTVASFGSGGLTVTPTLAAAGTTTNTVPAEAHFHVDARATTRAEQDALHARMAALSPVLPSASVTVEGGPNRPPMEAGQALPLLDLARLAARDLGLGDIRAVGVGGASDGNFTAGIGIPTLDGLGAVGAHAHAEGEYAVIAEMPRRAALVAGLVARLLPPV
ncbi:MULTISPECIES: M20/M25/M40 family metallo-hydrolase [Streptomyces]|uniref:M20/M25/M40 family metallo-hydrolase n=1 Tax=Streptomyces TaxID=1883 RepID=UPI00211AD1EC|nr:MULTISPECIES: M20/M25/M40 family metallo-hydrolase [Streptomyces]WUD30951.1 M20/M25/M40 family metallo-hydrolase [Streptomyces europaeiscabiei]